MKHSNEYIPFTIGCMERKEKAENVFFLQQKNEIINTSDNKVGTKFLPSSDLSALESNAIWEKAIII